MTDQATGASECHEDRDAVGSPVQCPVRPAAWMAHYRSRYDMPSVFVTTQHELAVENDAEGRPIPLYPQATIDAAVAAERERCAKLCDERQQVHETEADDLNSDHHNAIALGCEVCAAVIRGPNA